MARWVSLNKNLLAEFLGEEEIKPVYVFANTGLEHPDTLRFMNDVDRHFNLGVVWTESKVIHVPRKGTKHRRVTYETAYTWDRWRDPEHPFHSFIRKYGIPNTKFLGCTRELKRRAIASYMRSIGFKSMKDYYTCIGIRADEKRRVSKAAKAENVIYPLVDISPTDKEEIIEWWEDKDWDLNIPEWLGNCLTCYKKSYKKLKAVHEDLPRAFEFNIAMEEMYPRLGPEFSKYEDAKPRVFFRLSTPTTKLLNAFATDPSAKNYIRNTADSGCSESCELFETENAD